MTTTRFDICSPRPKKDGGTFWHRVGTAFQTEKGIGLIFDSLPLPDKEGRVSVQLFEPKPKDAKAGADKGNSYAEAKGKPARDDMEDEIPF